MDLHARFLSFAGSHGAADAVAEAWWQTMAARYGEPRRHYHTLRHIEEMLELLPDADETTISAVWFHYAV
jgi:predicted metal-dependent HD superfamily phosphohydrolase